MRVNWFDLVMLAVIFFLLGCVFSGVTHAENLPKSRVVNAIIGEAENQGYEGMLAVACAIRNRGTLKGVYGERSRRVTEHKYSTHTFVLAVKAYEESAKSSIVGKADVWGNKSDIVIFSRQKWFKSYRLVKQIGDHYFYERKTQ